MNAIDLARQRAFPTVMVPSREAISPLATDGERLLVAANGVFQEVRRPWIRLIRRIASFDGVTPIPYGDVTEQTELRCGEVPASLLGEFARMAAEAVPNETGAWIVWERISGTYRLIALDAIHRSSARLEYRRPALNDSEVLVVDCHSHGSGHAYFSSTDDLDDRYDVKVALVLGHCDRAEPEVAMRLCAKGIFEQANPPASWLIAMNARASS